MNTERHPIGSVGRETGLSPRMLRYLEDHGVVTPDRGPHGTGHRHYPPPEARIARAAADAMRDGHAVATLRTIRELAAGRVAAAREQATAIAWFELVALAREVELAAIAREPAPPPPPTPPPPPEMAPPPPPIEPSSASIAPPPDAPARPATGRAGPASVDR